MPGLREAFIESGSCISKSVPGIFVYDGFAKSLTVIIVAHKYLLSAASITNNFFSFRLTKNDFFKDKNINIILAMSYPFSLEEGQQSRISYLFQRINCLSVVLVNQFPFVTHAQWCWGLVVDEVASLSKTAKSLFLKGMADFCFVGSIMFHVYS